MKRVSLLFTGLLFILQMSAQQNYVWSEPEPFSDSLSDNTDATLHNIEFYAGFDRYVFWVMSTDTNSSDIVARRYYTVEEPVPVIFEGEFRYRNPQVIPMGSDTLFVLLYESDEDGDFDIYYTKYTADGFSDPIALTQTSVDEMSLDVSASGMMTWESEGTIHYGRMDGTWGGPVQPGPTGVVDSAGATHPSISKEWYGTQLAWQKSINDTNRILLSYWNQADTSWSTPEIVSDSGFNAGPRFSGSTWGEVPPTLAWDSWDGDSTRLMAYDGWYGEGYFSPDFLQVAPFNPHFFNIFVGVEWVWDYTVLTFEREVGDQIDIYGNTAWLSTWEQDYVNITNSPFKERNPYLFEGYFYWDNYMDVINIWESFRNGHWQLYTSKIRVLISGGVAEPGIDNGMTLSAWPNPFTDRINLTFEPREAGPVVAEIMDATGRCLSRQQEINAQAGLQNMEMELPASLAPGIYFVRLQTSGKSAVTKIIKR